MAIVKASSQFSTNVLLLSDLSLSDTVLERGTPGGWNWFGWACEPDRLAVSYDPLDNNDNATVTFSGYLPTGGLRHGVINSIENTTPGSTGDNDNYKITGLALSGSTVQDAIDTDGYEDDVALVKCAFSGCDVFELGNGNDQVNSYNGNDVVFAAGGNDSINGGNGRDKIYAGTGEDVVIGGRGGDRIDLGWDSDTDVVIYESTCDSNCWTGRDTIRNFDSGEDKIDLSALSDNLEWSGSHCACDGVWAHATWWGDTYLYADANGDGWADTSILVQNQHVTEGDLIL